VTIVRRMYAEVWSQLIDRNILDGKRPIEFQVSASLLAFMDPLVLDALSPELRPRPVPLPEGFVVSLLSG